MWTAIISLVGILCTGCALAPVEIEKAPAGASQAVVFDIDGTLTPTTTAIFTARDDAAKAVGIFADKGYKIVYLSARSPLFQAEIPGWLKKSGFPEGDIQVPKSEAESCSPAPFKWQILERYKSQGWTLVAGYGDSATDFVAYAAAGIPKDRIVALQRVGAESCEMGAAGGCFVSWTAQMGSIQRFPEP